MDGTSTSAMLVSLRLLPLNAAPSLTKGLLSQRGKPSKQ
jgi:hypothetical protein